jgi:outer membrane murein-binding lipoprotein Lpp
MATPQGWYPDPNDPTIVRWWDGQQWTSHTHPRSHESSSPVQTPPDATTDETKRSKPKLFGKGQALDEAHAEIDQLRAELNRLGVMDVVELQSERDHLQVEVESLRRAATAARSDGERQVQDIYSSWRFCVSPSSRQRKQRSSRRSAYTATATLSTIPSPIGPSWPAFRTKSKPW